MRPKILLIGLGRWGRNHLRVLTGLTPDIMVADPDPSRLEFVKPFSIPATTDWRKFLGEADAVDIVTPADTHLGITTECLEAGKDVFVEKPMAMSVTQAVIMNDFARNGNVPKVFQVGHIYRYDPVVGTLKSLMDKLGEIKYAHAFFEDSKEPRKDAGVTLTDAIHYFDLFNYLFDRLPVSAGARVVPNHGRDRIVMAVLDYGVPVHISATNLAPSKRKLVEIVGTKMSVACDFTTGIIHAIEGTERRTVPVMVAEPLAVELQDFMDCVMNRSNPLASGKVGEDALRVVEACYTSSSLGKTVEVK